MRSEPDALVEAVLVLGTLGAPARTRRPRPVDAAEPEPVPTSRATVVRPHPFESPADWLADQLHAASTT